MNASALLTSFSMFMVGLLMIFQPLVINAETIAASSSAPPKSAVASPAAESVATRVLEDSLSDIQIPPATAARFETVYWRHRAELYQIAAANPGLVWETVGLVLDALPALRSVKNNSGRLYLDQRTFGKANDVWEQYVRLASSGLATDLKDIKKFVDNRTKPVDSGRVVIDLNG